LPHSGSRRRVNSDPQLTQAQQLLPRSCASTNTGLRPTARSPARRHDGEPKVRLRVPTPMPRREVRDAFLACQDGSDHEDGRIVDSSPVSKVRDVPRRMPVASETRRARCGSEDVGSRVLSDITNLPQAQGLVLDGKEGKELQSKQAEKSWPECEQAVTPSAPPAADVQVAQVSRSILKESTRFAEKWMEKMIMREYVGEGSTGDAPANSVRRVHWGEDANDAMSPPRWYLRLRGLPSRQDEDAAGAQRGGGTRRELQRPRDRRVGSPASLTRTIHAAPLTEENLNSLDAGSAALPRWRR